MTTPNLSVAAPAPRPDGGFAPWHAWDRNAFLTLAAGVWFGIGWGFGTDILSHIAKHEPAYPLIVHVHALAFMGWLILFTGQILLVRVRRIDLHRRIGVGMVFLGAAMLVLGPATALVMDARAFGTPASDPPFLIQQFTDIAAFAGLAAAGVLLRARSSAHKRLMLLATLYISDAGFGRVLFEPLHKLFGDGVLPYWIEDFGAPTLLMLALGAYDLVTRHRLHPAYLAGMAYAAVLQVGASWLYYDPAWKLIALHLIGH